MAKKNIQAIREACITDLKMLIRDGILSSVACGDFQEVNLEAKPDEKVIEVVNRFLHECNIDERDGYAMTTGSINALRNILKMMGFPKTEGEKNLDRWAEILEGIYV